MVLAYRWRWQPLPGTDADFFKKLTIYIPQESLHTAQRLSLPQDALLVYAEGQVWFPRSYRTGTALHGTLEVQSASQERLSVFVEAYVPLHDSDRPGHHQTPLNLQRSFTFKKASILSVSEWDQANFRHLFAP